MYNIIKIYKVRRIMLKISPKVYKEQNTDKKIEIENSHQFQLISFKFSIFQKKGVFKFSPSSCVRKL